MSEYMKLAEQNGERYLSALQMGQENFLKYVSALTAWMPQPAGARPGISAMRDFSTAGFEFSERLLAQQKAFADKLLTPNSSRPKASQAKPAARPKATASSARRTKKTAGATATKAPVVRSSKKKPASRGGSAPTKS